MMWEKVHAPKETTEMSMESGLQRREQRYRGNRGRSQRKGGANQCQRQELTSILMEPAFTYRFTAFDSYTIRLSGEQFGLLAELR
jgi:hypothetical protein